MTAVSILKCRRQFIREKQFRDRNNPLDYMEELEKVSKFRLPRHLQIELCNRMDKYCSATCDRSPLLSCKYNHVNVQTCDIKQSRIQYRTLVHVLLYFPRRQGNPI